MPQPGELASNCELEQLLQAHPSLAAGTLQFIARWPARHSELLEYRLYANGGSETLIVKLQARGLAEHVLAEFENLQKITARLGPFLARTIPKPVFVSPEQGLLVMGKARGSPLTAILKKSGNRITGLIGGSRVGDAARQAGSWLRSFQHLTRTEPLVYDSDDYLSELNCQLNSCAAKGLPSALAEEILGRAALRSAPLDAMPLPAAACHSDFIPQNVLVEGGRIAVVDFEGLCERATVYEDLGSFLAYLIVLRSNLAYSPRALKIASQAFLRGFGAPLDKTLVNLYTLRRAVRILVDSPSLKEGAIRFSGARTLFRCLEQLATGRMHLGPFFT